MKTAAATPRDLSANREAAEDIIIDKLLPRTADILVMFGFDNATAGAYSIVLAEVMADAATTKLFDLLAGTGALAAAYPVKAV